MGKTSVRVPPHSPHFSSAEMEMFHLRTLAVSLAQSVLECPWPLQSVLLSGRSTCHDRLFIMCLEDHGNIDTSRQGSSSFWQTVLHCWCRAWTQARPVPRSPQATKIAQFVSAGGPMGSLTVSFLLTGLFSFAMRE